MFDLEQPGVRAKATAIGPRRPDQLDDLLAGAEVRLGDDVLDRIDEIVPPGVDVYTGDLYVDPTPSIQKQRLRRRVTSDGALRQTGRTL